MNRQIGEGLECCVVNCVSVYIWEVDVAEIMWKYSS